MILVTAATGKTGRHIVEALRQRGERVRAIARSESVHELGDDNVETVTADMLDRAALGAALEGARAVVFIGPTFNAMEIAMGRAVIDAAVAASVERFVQLSVYHPQIDFLVNHQAKLRTEDYLVNSGLEFTILQPMHYMQNYVPVSVAASGVLRVPYSLSLKRSYVDLVDVAEAAAIALTEDGHANATYPLTGPDVLSTEEVARLIEERAGVEVRGEMLSLPEFIEIASDGHQVSRHATDAVYRLFTYYSLHALIGNANVLRWVLGRKPTTFVEYIDRCFATNASESPLGWPSHNRVD